jgi:hypothetical protein
MKIRITASDPVQTFTLCGKLAVTAPTQDVEWVADGATANTISWDVYGKLDYINILYSTDTGATYPETIDTMVDAEAGDAAANKGSYSWTIPTTPGTGDYIPKIDLGNKAMIKIEDNDSTFSTDTEAPSPYFKVKGQLRVVLPDTSNGLDIDSDHTITVERDGRVEEVNVYFYDGSGYTSIESGVTFSPVDTATQASTSVQWNVPETPVNNAYKLMVEDANYAYPAGAYGETTPFRVLGAIDLTAPEAIGTWRITETKPFTWDITHGEIPKVKTAEEARLARLMNLHLRSEAGAMTGPFLRQTL